ncbi:hypothetical protein OIU84_027267 [Salix udensis]|uniref:Uncharacterized protein n=1 Tax=Salix udensis TaxID=889485 RepID=A0AAD6PAG6_9ROSI|nr:hypothetical protein OIU84_027267 [Salix udensis]
MGDSDKKTSSDISSDRYSMVSPNNGADHGEEGGWSSSGSMPETLPPRRRGLATSYDGKCKSFADLSEARTVKDLQKKEHPFNQMRALLKARKLCRGSMAQIGSAEVVGKGNP